MAVSGKTELDNRIPEIWAQEIYAELRANNNMFYNAFAKDYNGVIAAFGDTVNVNTIAAATGEILTDDKAEFASEAISISKTQIVVDKRASASFEITDTAMLQSMNFQNEAIQALGYAIQKKIEEDIIAALIPSASNPDHQIAPASAGVLAVADIATMRALASAAYWPAQNRILFADPAYYSDLITSTTLASRDYTNGNNAETGVLSAFAGLQIAEHNLLPLHTGYAFHPSAVQLVVQQGVRVKMSDLHANKKYGVLVSADILYGFKLMDNKRIIKISG